MSTMRRKDREVTDKNRIDEIIDACAVCRLAFATGTEPYIVPLSFGLEKDGEKRILYFHCAKQGRKIELAEKIGTASFEMDTFELSAGEMACDYTAKYSCVMGFGKLEVITDGNEEKRHALNIIMNHYTDKGDWEYSENMISRTCILKLEVQKISCKENR